jgi:uncharacterized LabA/DUF88 family protein
MKEKQRIAIYIDGSNFYKYLKDKEINFQKGIKFNFNKFIDFLVEDNICVSKRYYIGLAKNFDNSEKSEKIVRGQQKFLANLEKRGFVIKRSSVIYDNGKIREKGTDVKIAIDLVIGACDNLFDKAILISSDTDLIPAIKYLKYKGKKLEYVGFSHSPSLAMIKNSDFKKLLSVDDIEKFKDN